MATGLCTSWVISFFTSTASRFPGFLYKPLLLDLIKRPNVSSTLSQVLVQMDNVGNVPGSVLNDQDMVFHNGVSIMTRRRREPAEQVHGRGPNPSPGVGVERRTLLKPGFLFRRHAILFTKSLGKILTMLVVPFAGGRPIVVVKLGMRFSLLFPDMILCGQRGAGKG